MKTRCKLLIYLYSVHHVCIYIVLNDTVYFLLICHISAAGGACPDGWIPTPTDCYYVSDTSDFTKLLTWSQAKAKCVALNSGSHLLTIDDVHDQVGGCQLWQVTCIPPFVQARLPGSGKIFVAVSLNVFFLAEQNTETTSAETENYFV